MVVSHYLELLIILSSEHEQEIFTRCNGIAHNDVRECPSEK